MNPEVMVWLLVLIAASIAPLRLISSVTSSDALDVVGAG
tara:strand:+ start:100 stop:216 length:117 start_codon:yes stop_codon:yes gene_type:complete